MTKRTKAAAILPVAIEMVQELDQTVWHEGRQTHEQN